MEAEIRSHVRCILHALVHLRLMELNERFFEVSRMVNYLDETIDQSRNHFGSSGPQTANDSSSAGVQPIGVS